MRPLHTIGSDRLGKGPVTFKWNPKGQILAAAGCTGTASIFDQTGKLLSEVAKSEDVKVARKGNHCPCLQIEWISTGDKVAILWGGSSAVQIWDASNQSILTLDIGLKNSELTWIGWAKGKPLLLLGTTKGHVLIYNNTEKRKVPVMGKHTKKITCGSWSSDSLFALGAQDNQVTLSDGVSGDTLAYGHVNGEPVQMCIGQQKTDEIMGQQVEKKKSVEGRPKLVTLMELVFQDHYGVIQKHLWFGDGYIMVGFASGHVVVVSSHRQEVGEEIHSAKYLEDGLKDMAHCEAVGKVAIAGGRTVRILQVGTQVKEMKSEAIELSANEIINAVGWTPDGQVLTVATKTGNVYNYLASLPQIHSVYDDKILHLTSLQELCVKSTSTAENDLIMNTKVQPVFCGLGSDVLAYGMNNQVWFYQYSNAAEHATLLHQQDYLGTIDDIRINDICAILLIEGRVLVQPLEELAGGLAGDSYHVLPGKQSDKIMCCCLSEHFIVVGSSKGMISYYTTTDYKTVNEFRHDDGGIHKVFLQPNRTKLVFEDEMHNLFWFNPVNDRLSLIPDFHGVVGKVLWDCEDPNAFTVVEGNVLKVYMHIPLSLYGEHVKLIGKQDRPLSHTPVLMSNGSIWCKLENGTMDCIILETHTELQNGYYHSQMNEQSFLQALSLYRLRDTWPYVAASKAQVHLKKLGEMAIECLDLELAVEVYRSLQDARTVLSLQEILQFDDKSFIIGTLLGLLGKDPNLAQEELLKSSMPHAALRMRQDLKHWNEALDLAEQIDPKSVPEICKQHALKLEVQGHYTQSRAQYQQAIIRADALDNEDVIKQCQMGVARTTLHIGDTREGKQMALKSGNHGLVKECAGILEKMGHQHDAAELYEVVGLYEKAATIYINMKSFASAAPLMQKLDPDRCSKLQGQYAKAKEKEGKYEDALEGYQRAGDVHGMVRMLLYNLHRPEEAFTLVRTNPKIEPAGLIAEFCKKNAEFETAIEFLLLAKLTPQAWELAQKRDKVDFFTQFLSDDTPADELRKIGEYYESRQKISKAGDMYMKAGLYKKAATMYMQEGFSALEKAIDVVRKSLDRNIASSVLDWVLSESTEGEHQKYIFQLYIALGQYDEAAKTSLEIAKFEQNHGNYRQAHTQLFSTHQELSKLGKVPSMELSSALTLLHSYTIIRIRTALQDHMGAARLLVRVAQNVSKFPAHVVNILTSTVIESHRAGLKQTAFEYASMLMRPEYRQQIASSYKRKIEGLVRKAGREDDVEENVCKCPFCGVEGKEMDLQCYNCQNIIPFCIATGKRMDADDWGECPSCLFPARKSAIDEVLHIQKQCPMCQLSIEARDFKLIPKNHCLQRAMA